MPVWSDLSARSRGLGTRLLDRATLERLTDAPDLLALGDQLRASGVVSEIAVRRSSAEALEREVRTRSGQLMRILTAWAGSRRRYLSLLFEDEDRRSVCTIVRGTVQGAPAAVKMSGLIPTMSLPERALETLAARESIGEVAALLSVWRHPYSRALDPIAGDARPDLFVFERAVDRIFFARARRSVKRAGRSMRRFVADAIDLHNAFAALVLTERGGDIEVATLFIRGGSRLSQDDFMSVSTSEDAVAAKRGLRSALEGSVYESVFDDDAEGPIGLESRALHSALEWYRRRARLDPIGPAPVLGFTLRVRAEAQDIRRVIGGVAIGAPAAALVRDLVTLS